MKTIKIILLLFCIILGLNAKAQTVGYTYKALAAEGCNMKYSVAKQDTILFDSSNSAFRQNEFSR